MMNTTETDNLTVAAQCEWVSEENRTKLRAMAQLDSTGCLFLSLIPNEDTVPALICLLLLLTIFSVLANALTLLGIQLSEDLSSEPRCAFLWNLILSDLMQTLSIGPAVILSLVQRRTMEFSTWCYVQYFAVNTIMFSSVMTITSMAVERYVYVRHAIHHLALLTPIRLRLTLSFIWLFSVSIGVVNMVLLHTGPGHGTEHATQGLLCEPYVVERYMGFPRASAVFRKVVGTCTLMLCLCTHAFSYLRIYRDAQNAVIPFNAVNTRARRTLLFHCGALLLHLLPLLFKTATDTVWELKGAAAGFHLSLLIIFIVTPCINPLIFVLSTAELRQALRSHFRQWIEERLEEDVRETMEMRFQEAMPRNQVQQC